MLRYALMVTATLSLFTSINACTCLAPDPLSDCAVGTNQAALLVTMKCVKTVICDVNNGAAVVDVVIDKVFKDNTSLGLSVGDMVTVRSRTQGSLCGVGSSFKPETQWILFAGNSNLPGTDISTVFSDASVCEVNDADLSTGLCSGNIREPTRGQIRRLMLGCRFGTGPNDIAAGIAPPGAIGPPGALAAGPVL